MWRLTGNVAQLECGFLSASVDTSNLDAGLRNIKWFDDKAPTLVPGPLLKILIPREFGAAPPKLAELYVRQQDLVATYEELTQPRVRPQVYWREILSAVENAVAGIEVILSVQTSVLDSRPTIFVESQLGNNEVRTLRMREDGFLGPANGSANPTDNNGSSPPCVFLSQLTGTKLSYLEMAYPADFHDATVNIASHEGSATVRHHLHTERLEKGVIRRCRIRSLLIPSKGDEETAAGCLREFLASPLPLTT